MKQQGGSAKENLLALLKKKQSEPTAEASKVAPSSASGSPLTQLQQGIWFVDQLFPDKAEFNRPLYIEITGPLEHKRLEAAINNLIERHQNLRAFINNVDGELRQEYKDHITINLPVEEISGDDQEAALNQRCLQLAAERIDLEKCPLFTQRLLSVSPNRHVLLMVFQHIIFDAESARIVIRELKSLYEGQQLDPLPIQWADHAHWVQQQASKWADQLAYWKGRLQDDLPYLQLPEKPKLSAERDPTSRRVGGVIKAQQVELLKKVTQEHNTTVFVVLMALLKVLLYRYSGQSDIIVGTPVSGRNRIQVEPLIGAFINTLAIRTTIDSEASFQDHLNRVRQNLFKALDHQEISFETLIDELSLKNSQELNPVFRIMMELRSETLNLEGAQVSFKEKSLDRKQNYYDLSFSVREHEGDWTYFFEYQISRFEPQVMERMAMHFSNLLSSMLQSTGTPIGTMTMMGQSERKQILEDWNQTQVDYSHKPLTLHGLFVKQALKSPDHTAVTFENDQLSYQELHQRSDALAAHLQELGLKPEQFVAICMDRSLNMIVGLFAILKAGGAFVPIDSKYPLSRVQYILDDGQISVVLTNSSYTHYFSKAPHVIVMDDLSDTDLPLKKPQERTNPENLAYMIYTSGSTGNPKGVMIKHLSIAHNIVWRFDFFHLKPEDRTLQISSPSFDTSLWEIFCPLSMGAAVVLPHSGRETDAPYLIELIQNNEITHISPGPAMLSILIDDLYEAECPSLRHISVGGEELPLELMHQVLRLQDITLVNCYGPTECTIGQIFWRCDKNLSQPPVPIGKPADNFHTYILSEDLQPVPVGVTGTLYISGVGLAKGYLNKPELTQSVFIKNPFGDELHGLIYNTGDLAKFTEDGNILFLGRADYQVKIRGYRIELSEIEHYLNSHDLVDSSVVLAIEEEGGLKTLVGYLKVDDQHQIESSTLQKHLQANLPPYMIPSFFIFMDSFPLNSNGKIDRKRLPRPHTEAQISYLSPETPMEIQMAEVWCQILNLEQVGLTHNFFESGGDSLKAMRLISQIKKQYGLLVSIRMLFDYPVLKDFAAAIETQTH